MPNKYYVNPKFNKENSFSSQQLLEFVMKTTSDNDGLHGTVDSSGRYDGVKMELAPGYSDSNRDGEEIISEQARRGMMQYYEFVKNGGNLMKTKPVKMAPAVTQTSVKKGRLSYDPNQTYD